MSRLSEAQPESIWASAHSFRGPRSLDLKYATWRESPTGHALYTEVRFRALALKRRGVHRFGIQAIAESARFDATLDLGRDDGQFRVNNNCLSRLARELMDREIELADFFELRALRS